MVAESWQSYANMVGGVSRTLRDRAATTTRALLAQVGLEELAEEIGNASRANRELIENLLVGEVDKAAGRLGFVRAEEFAALRAEVAQLRAEVRSAAKARATAKKAPARKAAMKKAAESAAAAG